jgi:hypothetical protein
MSILNLGQPPATTPQWFYPNTPGNTNAFYNNVPDGNFFQVPFPQACTASNLTVNYYLRSSASESYTYLPAGQQQQVALQVRGNTALSCTTTPAAFGCTSQNNTASIKAGDTVNMAILSGTVGDNKAYDYMTVAFTCQ